MTNRMAIRQLAQRLTGTLLTPDDSDYDTRRALWNGMINRRPTLIACCAAESDVIAALGYARERGLTVSIKSGGHGVAGRAVCDDGLMIDLSPLAQIDVDTERKIARVGAGCRLGQLDGATQAHGLVTTAGVDSRTGVAGLTLGGGLGFLARSHGLTIDNLIGVTAVTANGDVVRADAQSHSELFWALRGGGHGLAVVTSFEYQLHDLAHDVLVGQVFVPADAAPAALRHYREFMTNAPNDVACYALFTHVPAAQPFPSRYHGEPALALVACYAGDPSAGRTALQPLESIEQPIVASIAPMPYTALQQSFDAGAPDGGRYYWKSHYLEALPDTAIDALAEHARVLPGPYAIAGLEPMGGAIADVASDATAFPHRSAAYTLGIWAGWSDPSDDAANIAWARDFHAAMTPYASGGAYANYLDFDDDRDSRAAYGANQERLQAVRRQYDPDGLLTG